MFKLIIIPDKVCLEFKIGFLEKHTELHNIELHNSSLYRKLLNKQSENMWVGTRMSEK